jgi:hypothetical protein
METKIETKYEWIHDLIKAEEQMEETGIIDFESSLDPDRTMIGAALSFLGNLRKEFTDAVEIFNEMKSASQGKLKVYGIAKTHADFMLFRNGFKLIFSLKLPGVISIRTHFVNPALPSVASMNLIGNNVAHSSGGGHYKGEEELIEMMWGPFNESIWTYRGQPVRLESVVKHYMTKFIQDTANPGL